MINSKENIYLLSMAGVEWEIPLLAFEDCRTAKKMQRLFASGELKVKKSHRWLTDMSYFKIEKIKLIKNNE